MHTKKIRRIKILASLTLCISLLCQPVLAKNPLYLKSGNIVYDDTVSDGTVSGGSISDDSVSDDSASENSASANTASGDQVFTGVINDGFELPISGNAFASAGVQSLPSLLPDGSFGMVKLQRWKLNVKNKRTNNDDILRIKDGHVIAWRGGTALLTTAEGDYNVIIATPEISPETLRLQVGLSRNIVIKGLLTGQKISWFTTNPNVAQVYNGTVYGTGRGTATVYARIGARKFATTVIVKDAPESEYLMDLFLGKPQSIKVPGAKNIQWETPPGVTITNGKIKASVTGNFVVSGNDGHKLICYMNLGDIKIGSGLYYSPKPDTYILNMDPGEWFILDFPGDHYLAKWITDNARVASVTPYGLVYADNKGKATLSTKVGKKRIKVKVIVGQGSSVSQADIGQVNKTIVDGINGHQPITVSFDAAHWQDREDHPEKYTESRNSISANLQNTIKDLYD